MMQVEMCCNSFTIAKNKYLSSTRDWILQSCWLHEIAKYHVVLLSELENSLRNFALTLNRINKLKSLSERNKGYQTGPKTKQAEMNLEAVKLHASTWAIYNSKPNFWFRPSNNSWVPKKLRAESNDGSFHCGGKILDLT